MLFSKNHEEFPRSASVASFQVKKPPFANYGWATRTKDMSVKPTHNALANKVILLLLNKTFRFISWIIHLLLIKIQELGGYFS